MKAQGINKMAIIETAFNMILSLPQNMTNMTAIGPIKPIN